MDPLNERQLEQARDVREKILLLKWQKRQRVTRAEADELRPVIGEVEYAKLLSIIEAAPSEPASRTEYVHTYKHYAGVYKVSERQIIRWVNAGRYAPKPELPPLDHLTPRAVQ